MKILRVENPDRADRPTYRFEIGGVLWFEAHQGQDPECWNFRTEEGDDWTFHVCDLPTLVWGMRLLEAVVAGNRAPNAL